jgi:nucleoside-diphosphate-sugar epimerase
VIGGHGFVGPWLRRHLEECGDEVIVAGADLDVTDASGMRETLAGTDVVLRVDPVRLRPSDVPEMRGDFSRLQKATGWEPRTDLDETLQDVLTYWTSEVLRPPSFSSRPVSSDQCQECQRKNG